MNRKNFIKVCGMACMGGTALVGLLEGCSTTRLVTANISNDDLVVPLHHFNSSKAPAGQYRNYVIVQNERLQYPICLYRVSATIYTALWMRCTHQGAELQVFGNKLQCPAHGSEFNADGGLRNGPAALPLRTFPVVIDGDRLMISLKAV